MFRCLVSATSSHARFCLFARIFQGKPLASVNTLFHSQEVLMWSNKNRSIYLCSHISIKCVKTNTNSKRKISE